MNLSSVFLYRYIMFYKVEKRLKPKPLMSIG